MRPHRRPQPLAVELAALAVIVAALAAPSFGCGSKDKTSETAKRDGRDKDAAAARTEPESKPPELDTSCEVDDDCRPAPGCCPAPCTGHVINKKDLDRARAWIEASCPADQECPSAGACMSHLYICEEKTCRITYAGEPAYEKRTSTDE